jgi:CheY-like chemotaxis protein
MRIVLEGADSIGGPMDSDEQGISTDTERPPVAVTRPASPPLRILVAEDNAVNQELMTCVLEGRGHTVTIARNGREAVDAVRADDFDLVLMDVQMPEMDGYQATALIRAGEARGGRRLPIIGLTASAQPRDTGLCLAAGMNEFVTKPVRPALLIEIIARCVADAAAPNNGAPAAEGDLA